MKSDIVKGSAVILFIAAMIVFFTMKTERIDEATISQIDQHIEGQKTSLKDELSAHSENESERKDNGSSEIIGSIYDYDIGYQERAVKAAEDFVALLSPESVLRWRAVRLKESVFVTDNYLAPNAVKKTFRISPFPSTEYAVTESRYMIRDETDTVSWKGSILGSETGRVELTIVGGVDKPGFFIRIIDGHQVISIFQTETPDVYVTLEGNPNQPVPR